MKRCDMCLAVFDETKQKMRVWSVPGKLAAAIFCEFCTKNTPLEEQLKKAMEVSLLR